MHATRKLVVVEAVNGDDVWEEPTVDFRLLPRVLIAIFCFLTSGWL